jgi:hypothetical protein
MEFVGRVGGGDRYDRRSQKRPRTGDLFRLRLDQIIDMEHESVQLTGKIGWGWTSWGFRCLRA